MSVGLIDIFIYIEAPPFFFIKTLVLLVFKNLVSM